MPPKTGSAVSSPIQRRFTYFFQATSTEASGRARNQIDKTSLGTRIKRPPIDYNSPRSCRTRGPAIAAHLVLRVVYPVLDTAGVARYWTREREETGKRKNPRPVQQFWNCTRPNLPLPWYSQGQHPCTRRSRCQGTYRRIVPRTGLGASCRRTK